MIDNYSILVYKWQQGIYSLQDMINLVKQNKITSQDFFKITRYNYAAVAQKM